MSPKDQSSVSLAHSEAIDFVKALQSSKVAQTEMQKLSSAEILEKIQRAISEAETQFSSWAALEALDQGISENFLIREIYVPWLNRILNWKDIPTSEDSQQCYRATGVVAISVPWCLAFHSVMDRMIPALIAGNSVIVHLSEWSPRTVYLIESFITLAQLPAGAVQVLLGRRKEIAPLMAGHPGISALSWAGNEKHKLSIIKAVGSTTKKLQIHTGSKNSLILLPGRTQSLEDIMSSCLVGRGQMVWNTTRIFILESEKESFLNELKTYLLSISDQPAHLIHRDRVSGLEQVRKGLSEEQGKPLLPSSSDPEAPLFTLDLSNCSEWQQEELQRPVFIISSVKYSHEIAKWTNTGTYGHMAVIYGDNVKARSLAEKLDVGLVCINHWKIPSLQDFCPLKSSAYGNTSLSPRGTFFSEVIKIDSLTPASSKI